MTKPLILITNDDGISAPGIKALIEVCAEIGEVVIIAPDSPQSGQGHAITLETPLRIHESSLFPDIEAYECSGTPVDCVKLAKHIIIKERAVDLCVSGINHGSNAATNILYSGTMSAAMEASMEGINSIGFSLLDYRHEANFEEAKPYIKAIIQHVLDHGMVGGNLYNVNIPKLKKDAIKGIKICRQADARWKEDYAEATDPRGKKYYWLTGSFVNNDFGDDTDVTALKNGYISIVPSHHDLTNYKALKEDDWQNLTSVNFHS